MVYSNKKEMIIMSQSILSTNQNSERFKLYYNSIICQDLLLKNNYTSIFEIPTLEKIVINTTSSAYANDRKNLIPALLALELITGQKAKFTCAKKSLASFKIRENQILGCKVTLRKKHLYNFLTVFTSIVLPKLRDFSGISKKSLDTSGNLSLGFTNLLVFPHLENHFEFFQNIRGMNINFSSNRASQSVNRMLYSAFQIPESK
jgi:large subunit ribosomal protein L5